MAGLDEITLCEVHAPRHAGTLRFLARRLKVCRRCISEDRVSGSLLQQLERHRAESGSDVEHRRSGHTGAHQTLEQQATPFVQSLAMIPLQIGLRRRATKMSRGRFAIDLAATGHRYGFLA
ncbi:MAG TPA: hypothetical protein VES67_01640 [Vicinamibacterales bacterium]|nr:hypothetical protein [Vicinamibacterales bacterium]